MDNVVQLSNGSFRPPEPHLVLKLLVGLTVLFEGVGICPKQDGSGNEINDMPAAPKPAVLLIEAKLSSELVKTGVVAFCVVCDKVSDATFQAIFVDDFANSTCKVFTTMTPLNLRQAEKKRAKLPFVVKKVYGEAEQRCELAGRPHVKGDINATK
jgi:hypothetical protein